ncbi:MAG: Rsd/AlgQ family anti-sigma factor [Gammaproteobacteria bacterium]|nr:Rsd/AlgQ family anti-sigma factor [Gammaproteobacteria bacterium]
MNQTASSERRNQQVINELLTERQEMLAEFCALAGLEPYTGSKPALDKLRRFMQVMVDYIALGHFEVYQHIAEGRERRTHMIEAAAGVYPKLVEATDVCVAFNDKYEGVDDTEDLLGLDEELSALGETLATRIELEDRLIAALRR